MRQDSGKTAGNMITMEEYLKKRQAIRRSEEAQNAADRQEAPSALKLAELLLAY